MSGFVQEAVKAFVPEIETLDGLLIIWVAEVIKTFGEPYVSNEMLDAFRYQHDVR